jgi:hypothetical protein
MESRLTEKEGVTISFRLKWRDGALTRERARLYGKAVNPRAKGESG